jgi:hypothetical protein
MRLKINNLLLILGALCALACPCIHCKHRANLAIPPGSKADFTQSRQGRKDDFGQKNIKTLKDPFMEFI